MCACIYIYVLVFIEYFRYQMKKKREESEKERLTRRIEHIFRVIHFLYQFEQNSCNEKRPLNIRFVTRSLHVENVAIKLLKTNCSKKKTN